MPDEPSTSLDASEIHVVRSTDGRTFLIDAFTAAQAERDVDQIVPDGIDAYYVGSLQQPLEQYRDTGIALLEPDPEVGEA